MKKLIKISDYYYVVDDKAEIKKGDYYTTSQSQEILEAYDEQMVSNVKYTLYHKLMEICKVIATNNHSLKSLPQITNANDDMVGKEVEIATRYDTSCKFDCNLCILRGQIDCKGCIKSFVNVKPISKGTKLFQTPKEFQESIKTSTNKTIEEAAELEYTDSILSSREQSILKTAFIKGANWQKEQDKAKFETYETMIQMRYTEEEVFELLFSYNETMWIDNRTLYSNESMREWFENNKKK